jgi:hypothetical protein
MELALKTDWLKSEPSKEWLNSHQDEDFFIDFRKNPEDQLGAIATVQINLFSEKLTGNNKVESFSYIISGLSIDAYRKVLSLDFIKLKDEFIDLWKFEKTEYQNKILKNTFAPADTAEQLSTQLHINNLDTKKFAEKSDKNFANIWKEVRGQRKISIDQALNYSKVLNCDPVDLLFEELKCQVWGAVDLLSPQSLEDYDYVPGQVWNYDNEIVTVPRDIYRPSIKAIKIKSAGSIYNNHIIFYYKGSDIKNYHGKLVVVGKKFVFDEFGIDDIRYFFGIYENARGKINILNPDPFAKNKVVIEDIVDPLFISPVAAIIDPILTKKSNRVRSAILRKDIQDKLNEVEKTLLKTRDLLLTLKDKKKSIEAKHKYVQVLGQYERLLTNLDSNNKIVELKPSNKKTA